MGAAARRAGGHRARNLTDGSRHGRAALRALATPVPLTCLPHVMTWMQGAAAFGCFPQQPAGAALHGMRTATCNRGLCPSGDISVIRTNSEKPACNGDLVVVATVALRDSHCQTSVALRGPRAAPCSGCDAPVPCRLIYRDWRLPQPRVTQPVAVFEDGCRACTSMCTSAGSFSTAVPAAATGGSECLTLQVRLSLHCVTLNTWGQEEELRDIHVG